MKKRDLPENEFPMNGFPENENAEPDTELLDEMHEQLFQTLERRRKWSLVLRVALISFLVLAVLLIVAVLAEQSAQKSQALLQKQQMQNEYNRVLLKAESDLNMELRPFTPEEEAAMLSGERTPQEVVDAIVAESATPVPEFSGKTQDEVIAYYESFLEQCEAGFLSDINALIETARDEWQEAKKTEADKKNWLTKYTARINEIEYRADKEFDGYMDNMKSELKDIDGSLDEDDLSIVSSFYARYNEEKERTINRFTEAYHLSEN